jgi:hypothetical protein
MLTSMQSNFRHFSFTATMWKWSGNNSSDKGSWYFLTVPKTISQKVRSAVSMKPRRGFGSVPVLVTIGMSRWRTSVFPDTKLGSYILPIKASVRKAERIKERARVVVRIELVGVTE